MVNRLCDLDIYANELSDRSYVIEPAPASPLEPLVAPARRAAQSVVDYPALASTWQRGREAAATGSAHSRETLERLRGDPGLVTRAALVALCGLGGVVMGYRGGGLRRLALGGLGAGLGAGVCYPRELADAAGAGVDWVKSRAA